MFLVPLLMQAGRCCSAGMPEKAAAFTLWRHPGSMLIVPICCADKPATLKLIERAGMPSQDERPTNCPGPHGTTVVSNSKLVKGVPRSYVDDSESLQIASSGDNALKMQGSNPDSLVFDARPSG